MTKLNLSPPWKTLLKEKLAANIKAQGTSATYVSLATLHSDLTPANRTVVFRGFAGESHREETGWQSDLLTITCDKRSPKIQEIAENPNAEINW
ncbi:pyridoxamine 5'-phosphate oxidase [Spinellus fusiger]|nr:pyridoxamine 5'-phosphate oxidase [Spinellus fusiger]